VVGSDATGGLLSKGGSKGPCLGEVPTRSKYNIYIYIYICILYNSFVMTIHIVAEMVYSGTLSTVI
jgi:hypothetical protein